MNHVAHKEMTRITKTFQMNNAYQRIVLKELFWGDAKPYVTMWVRVDIDHEYLNLWTPRSTVHCRAYYNGEFVLAIRSNRDVDSVRFIGRWYEPIHGDGCPIALRAGETLSCEPPYFGRFMCNASHYGGLIFSDKHARQIEDGKLVIEVLIARNYKMCEMRRCRSALMNEICEYPHRNVPL